jgi:hypothetical protein
MGHSMPVSEPSALVFSLVLAFFAFVSGTAMGLPEDVALHLTWIALLITNLLIGGAINLFAVDVIGFLFGRSLNPFITWAIFKAIT